MVKIGHFWGTPKREYFGPVNIQKLEFTLYDDLGNILDLKFSSFIGRHPIPVRHGLTIGEVALMHQKYWSNSSATMEIIKLENWNRSMYNYKKSAMEAMKPLLQKSMEKGKTIIGGCCIGFDDPTWECSKCKQQIWQPIPEEELIGGEHR